MAPDDWEGIKRVFTNALGVPPAHRDAYLELACAGRPDLRAAVDELLAAHLQASPDFLEHPTIALHAPWLFRKGDLVANRFRVTRAIARGAIGEVYEVFDERLQQRVALKAIRPELIGDAHTAARFRREVLVTREISHDSLCRIFDFVEHVLPPTEDFPNGLVVPCLTMQCLDGESLEALLERERPLPAEKARPIVAQVIAALQVLHLHKVIHRDLKPSNVLLVPQPDGTTRAILTDFGLARPLEGTLFETQADVHGGAPYFMAPELFDGERPDISSDVYALGLLIDEMVTRERAFSATSLHALLMQKLNGAPTPPSERATDLPVAWQQTIVGCLARDKDDRFANVVDVLAALNGQPPDRRAARARSGRSRQQLLRTVTLAASTVVLAFTASSPNRETREETVPSVVVAPFANLTAHSDYDYLCRGTAGELARRLSLVPNLRVYETRDGYGPQPGPARLSLDGHMQETTSGVRVTVELKETAHGALLWSHNFESSLERPLALQDVIAAETVTAIQDAVGERRQENLPPSATNHQAAFDAYLRGRFLFEQRSLTTAVAAKDELLRAISLDPGFALAYAQLADLQGVLMDFDYAPHETLIAEARKYAERATALDPRSAEGQLALAAVRQMELDWTGSEQAYLKAIELHPAFARAYRWYGGLLLQSGRFDESVRLARRAVELDPYDYSHQSALALILFYAGRPAEAISQLEQTLSRNDFLYAHAVLGQVYASLARRGQPDAGTYLQKALAEADILRGLELKSGSALDPGDTKYADLVAALAWASQDNAAAAAPFLQRLERHDRGRRISPATIARVYAALGDSGRALDCLELAERSHQRDLLTLRVSPFFTSLQSQPRFQALLRRLHLSS